MSNQTSATYEHEVKAIGDVLASLDPLSGPARERVLAYVANALNIGLVSPTISPSSPVADKIPLPPPSDRASASSPSTALHVPHSDIRSLRDSKNPRSAVEMAAIVAFYLSELAPEGERRQTIGTPDLDKYFKQAGFRLPKAQNMTLVNAAAAGYFDRVSQGEYKLNPVGYNLVAHNLPSRKEPSSGTRSAGRTRAAKKPTAQKKVAPRKRAVQKKTTTASKSTSR